MRKMTCHLNPTLEKAASLLILMGAVVFGLYILWPLMQPGYSRGGDDVIHMAYHHEAAAIMAGTHNAFGWSYLFGFGAPIFLFRPPLQYLCVAALHTLSGGALPISLLQKLFYMSCLAFYPAAVFYMMRKFRFTPLAAAMAALFSITPISMWGHTLHAYFWLGIMKQLVAIFLFPIALGRVHGTVSQGNRVLPTSAVIALAFLSHPYVPFGLLLVCAVYWLVILAGSGWRPALLAGARMGLIWGLTALLLAFYLLPFYTSPEIQQREFSASWRHAFEIVCETTAMTLNHFFKGGLFDTTRWTLYGGGEWGWPNNTFTGRWPVLSAMCLLGILVCLWRRRQFNAAVVILASTLTLFLFLGPDDVTLLNYLPFHDQFQNVHGVFLLDFFAVCLAGIGAAELIRRLGEWPVGAVLALRRRPPPEPGTAREPGGRIAQALVIVLVAAGALAVIYSPYRDRAMVAKRIALTKRFDTVANGAMTPSTLQQPLYTSLQKVQEILRSPEHPGRFYASAQDQENTKASHELFVYSILPGLVGRTDIICGFFSAEVAGVNKTVIERFRPQIPKYPNLIELFNVRYLLTATPNTSKLAGVEAYSDTAYQDSYWTLWRARGDFSHFTVLPSKPLLVYADLVTWREFCFEWIDEYKNTPDPAKYPYFVYGGERVDGPIRPDPERFPGVVILGSVPVDGAGGRALRDYAGAGGALYGTEPLADVPLTLLPVLANVRFADFPVVPAAGGTCRETRVERERHGASVEWDGPGLAVFKMAYYRSWVPLVDGRKTELVEVSPGLCGTWIPAGRHDLEFVYRGPNNYRLGRAVSVASLAVALAILGLQAWRKKTWEAWLPAFVPRSLAGSVGTIRGGVIALLLAAAGLFLLRGYVLEQFLHVPVPIRPIARSEMPTDILVDWNFVKQKPTAVYDVQIDDTSRRFENVVYEVTGVTVNYARKTKGLAPGHRFWWRVRSRVDGKASPWSRPISFRTAPDPRVLDPKAPFFIRASHEFNADQELAVRGQSNLPDGALLHVRLCRPDDMERLQSADVRVSGGGFSTVLKPPAKGWGYSGPAILCCDLVYVQQGYPVTSGLGPYGRLIPGRGLAPGHSLIQGLVAEAEVPPPAARSAAAAAVHSQPLDKSRPEIRVSARFGEDAFLNISGATSLPDNTQLRIKVLTLPNVDPDPTAQRDVIVKDGVFSAACKLDVSRGYRVSVHFTPDVQYQSVRRQLGNRGEAIEKAAVPEQARMYGLRSESAVTLGSP